MEEILITHMSCDLRETDLIVTARFRLRPLKVLIQHVLAKVFFDKQFIKSLNLKVPHHFAKGEMEIKTALSLERVRSGSHTIGLLLTRTSPFSDKEVMKSTTINYDSKIEMLLEEEELPKVKSISSSPIVDVVTDEAKELFRQMAERYKREIVMKRER